MNVRLKTIEFIEFEEEENLFERLLNGIAYWGLMRGEIFSKIINVEMEIAIRHPDLEILQSVQSAFFGCLKMIPNFHNDRINNHDFDQSVLFCASRRDANSEVDILLQHYKGHAFLIDRPYKFHHLPLVDSVRRMQTDWIDFKRGIKIKILQYITNRFKNELSKEIDYWLPKLNNRFHINIEKKWIADRMIHKLVTLKSVSSRFKKIFENHAPQILILTNHSEAFSLALIFVAHEFNIPVIEITHGYTNSHPSYAFIQEHNDFLPDEILVFGEYWKDMMLFPNMKRLIPCGSIELENQLKKYSSLRKKNYITFVSQGPFVDVLYPMAIRLANYLQDINMLKQYKIIYKLHPSETLTWGKLHPEFNDARITILGSESNIYKLMGESNVFVGVNSTAIFECIAFNVVVGVINCKYISDDMIQFCDMGYGNLVSTEEDIFDLIEKSHNGEIGHNNIEYIWKKDALRNTIREIDKVIQLA